MWNDYRKRPVVIQAVLLTEDNIREVGQQVGAHRLRGGRGNRSAITSIIVPTLEGMMTASIGDYVIKGVRGEFYPIKADIFHDTYWSADD